MSISKWGSISDSVLEGSCLYRRQTRPLSRLWNGAWKREGFSLRIWGFIKRVESVAIEVWKWTYAELKGVHPLLYVSSVGRRMMGKEWRRCGEMWTKRSTFEHLPAKISVKCRTSPSRSPAGSKLVWWTGPARQCTWQALHAYERIPDTIRLPFK